MRRRQARRGWNRRTGAQLRFARGGGNEKAEQLGGFSHYSVGSQTREEVCELCVRVAETCQSISSRLSHGKPRMYSDERRRGEGGDGRAGEAPETHRKVHDWHRRWRLLDVLLNKCRLVEARYVSPFSFRKPEPEISKLSTNVGPSPTL